MIDGTYAILDTMKRGFTVVELMIVIVVLALLATLVMFGYQRWRQDAAYNSVRTDLQAASQAMNEYRNFNNTYPNTAQLKNTYKSKATITVQSLDSGRNFCLTGVGGSPEITLYLDSRNDTVGETAC